MPVATSALRMEQTPEDAKGKILSRLSDAAKLPAGFGNVVDFPIDEKQPLARAGVCVFGPDYLVAIYDRSGERMKSGLFLPKDYKEDLYQGKVALVVGIGPLCQGPEYEAWFNGHPPQIGEWVVCKITDGFNYLIGDVMMKQVEWKYLRSTTVLPDLVM